MGATHLRSSRASNFLKCVGFPLIVPALNAFQPTVVEISPEYIRHSMRLGIRSALAAGVQ